MKGGFSEPAGSLLPELVCLLWCPVAALGVVGHNSDKNPYYVEAEKET